MDIKNEFKNGVKLCADAATDVAQALVEKSRLKAKANRIKQVIKADTELKNQAYIELGRYFYENMRDAENAECEALCVVIDKTTARIDKASRRYVELMSDSSDVKIKSENTEKIKKIVSDTAEDIKDKAKETGKKAKDKALNIGDKAKTKAQDISVKAKETVADLKDKAKDKVDDFKSFIAPEELESEVLSDIEEAREPDKAEYELFENTQEVATQPEQSQVLEVEVPVLALEDEESPEEFEF